MLRITRWNPDTCGCVIDLEWDDTANPRLHRIGAIVPCPAHPGAASDVGKVVEDLTSHPHRHNRRKNRLLAAALENLTELRDILQDGSYQLKNGIDFHWSWTGTNDGRIVTIWFTGITLSDARKAQMQTWADNNIGPGKVIVL